MAFVLSALTVVAQTKTITGIITDQSGTPLSGATVNAKGTKVSTQTDQNGNFKIAVPASSTKLVISYVGAKTTEVSIEGKTVISVSLDVTQTKLTEVVVIGYGQTKRSNVSTAISTVSEKDLKNLVVTGVDQAIQGKVAGVSVTNNSGQPGGGVSLRIRGITTINSNDPLIVIDGVPFTSNTIANTGYDALGGSNGQTGNSVMATLNPNDIASVDILKDASAQAIYGSQAANGVILITTKKGKKGEGKISYDYYFGQSRIAKKLDMMNLQQFAMYQNQLATPDGVTPKIIDSVAEFRNPVIIGK